MNLCIIIHGGEVIQVSTKRPRYTIIVEDALLEEIEDFRFKNRYPSRSAATLELIRLGMDALKQKEKNRPRR